MKLKKGSKVEVLSKKEVPLGAWRCAKVISSSGCNYRVMYDCSLGTASELIVEKVSRKAIRPRPPPVEGVESWTDGDVVEVFDDLSWKISTVLKVMGGGYYLVRLIGSSREVWVYKSNIRVRQSWQNNKWVVIGKGSGTGEDVKYDKLSTLDFYQRNNFHAPRAVAKNKLQGGDDCLAVRINPDFQESHIVSSRTRTLKRASPHCSFRVKANTGNIQKMRAIEKEGAYQQVMSGYQSRLLEKVDDVAYPQNNMGETYMHASFNNQTTGYHYYDIERVNSNGVTECFLSRGPGLDNSDRDSCSIGSSVGSCGVISNSPNKFSSPILPGPCQDCSDAEPFNGRGEEDVAARIHRLELHAYHCTLEALYASGTLSWEQQALLTNLRSSLHISGDEHLMKLRNLICGGISSHTS